MASKSDMAWLQVFGRWSGNDRFRESGIGSKESRMALSVQVAAEEFGFGIRCQVEV